MAETLKLTNYQLIMTAVGGSSWCASATTLLLAHKQMQHMIKSWQEPGCSEMVRFELIECCDACNGMGVYTLSKAVRGKMQRAKDVTCHMCKGKNSQVHIVDWKRLEDVLSTSAQFIRACENVRPNAIMGGDGTHLGAANPLLKLA